MKIGINNIYTSFWFVIMLLFSGLLTYLSFSKEIFSSDFIFIGKIIMGLIIALFIGISLYLLYKFRILILNDTYIISISPFLLKKQKINRSKISKTKWSNWTGQKGTVYRMVEIKEGETKISFSDMEFENFDSLSSEIYKNRKNGKLKVDLIQAKGNISSMKFNVYILIGFLIFLIINTIFNSGLHLIIIMFLIINSVLIYASIKRKMRYERIIKNG